MSSRARVIDVRAGSTSHGQGLKKFVNNPRDQQHFD